MESPWPEFSDKNNSFIHAGPGKLFLSFRRWMFFWKLESYSLLAPLRFPLSSVGCEHWSFQPLVAQTVRNLPVIQETQVWSLGQEDPLEKEMATHYSILAWGIPWTEEPGGLWSVGLQKSKTRLSNWKQQQICILLIGWEQLFGGNISIMVKIMGSGIGLFAFDSWLWYTFE